MYASLGLIAIAFPKVVATVLSFSLPHFKLTKK